MDEIEKIFTLLGGKFCIDPHEFKKRSDQVVGFIFDWDGVFHSGKKGEGRPAVFSESDSMGINILRYALWRKNRTIPFVAVISGTSELTVLKFGQREHFNAIYTGVANKSDAVAHLCRAHQCDPKQVACIFDDVNDISMAKICGLRIQVRRTSSPLFLQYTQRNNLCDYITAHPAGNNAVREICELLMGVSWDIDGAINERAIFSQDYQDYWSNRNHINTCLYSWEDGRVIEK